MVVDQVINPITTDLQTAWINLTV